MVRNHHTIGVKIVHALVLAAFLLGNLHHRAHIIIGNNHCGFHIGLLDIVDLRGRRQLRGVVHLHHLAVGLVHMIDYRGRRRDELELVAVVDLGTQVADVDVDDVGLAHVVVA